MKVLFSLFLSALLVAVPGLGLAQMHGGGMHGGGAGQQTMSGQHTMGPDYRGNAETMNEMMRDMNQLRGKGSLTPEHQREMQQMMDQLGDMRQQMRSSQGADMQVQHQRQLREMQQHLNSIKSQTQR
jgi:hypothetical protein